MAHSQTLPPDSELLRLASAWCDDAITDAELAKLQAVLSADPRARLQFISYMGVHGGIKTEIVAGEHIESFISLPGLSAPPTAAPPSQFLQFRRWLGWNPARVAWAAAILVAVLGAGAAWYFLQTRAADLRGSPDHQAVANHPGTLPEQPPIDPRDALARVAEQSADCQWYFDRSGKVPTDMIRSGETVRVTSGMMKLQFDNGTLVTLHAPAIFEVISDMRARVLLGKVTAKIGPSAKGFSIITPQATVIDLGTEFGIDVNEVGATDVVVFRGAVDVDYPTTLEGSARKQHLQTGEAVHLDAKGTASRIVAITNGQFADKPSSSDKPPIITEVRDNIERESAAWNFYEIVHGGMAEDAKAFVDREAHEWNGVTASGMPSYLLGGDYVKTFNNDKVRKDIELSVTVAHPCRLFILFDDRIPAPDWLAEGFRNTGDKIGVDEGPYMVGNGKWKTEHQPGVGPGVSVDNVDSIWECDILEPGTIRLGGTETPVSAINMYGIVAVPLEKAENQPPQN